MLGIPEIKNCHRWALFLDIDGTLVDIAPTPESVVILPTLPNILTSISQALNGALALISGRPMSDIDRMFPVQLDAAGTHGAEWQCAGVTMREDSDRLDAIANIMPRIQERVYELPGLLLEKKRQAIALHYRQNPERKADAWALAEQVVTELGADFRLLAGNGVVEIVAANVDKGKAIERFMTVAPYIGRVPVFAGDDVTDESGFQVINRMNGISIKVGDTYSQSARFRIASTIELRSWLVAIATKLKEEL